MALHRKSDPAIPVEAAVKILTYIIGLVGFLPVARRVGLPYSLAFAVLYLFSLFFEYRRTFPIPRRFLNLVSFSAVLSAFFRIRADDVVVPFLETLVVLLAVKFLEEKRFRDFMQIYVISVFLLAGSSLLSLDAVFLFYFIGLVSLLTATTVLLAYYSQDSAMALKRSTAVKVISNSLLIFLVSVPVTLLMFIILPRTNYPLLDFLNKGAAANTGFSDDVRLGRISGIQEDPTIILRVSMEKVDEDLLYWRGIVLDHFDGASWRSSPKKTGDMGMRSDIPGARVWQIIYLEPYGNKYFFALDKPIAVPSRRVQKYSDLTCSRPYGITKRTKYQALSALGAVLPAKDIDRNMYLQLPGKGLERTEALVKRLFPGRDKEATIRAVLKFLRDGDYRYSLKNLPLSPDPLETFLFERKYGNCEYFASAMAVMLRMADIPSRLVGGYRGGDYNGMGGYYLVPQKNAHVWVEAYLDGKGWIREDPTPAAPESFAAPLKGDMLQRVRLLLDAISYYWNASVINYDFESQMSLLMKLESGLKRPHMPVFAVGKGLARRFLSLLAAVSGVFMLYLALSGRKPVEEKILAAFLKKMSKLGYSKAKSEGLEEFAAKIEDAHIRESAYRFVKEFEGYFYRDRKPGKDEARKLKELIREIKL